MKQQWYQKRYRRMLLDMHIPDWDEAFLSEYDPKQMAELYERARGNEVMLYCQSHVGLCNWPTKTGKMHAGLGLECKAIGCDYICTDYQTLERHIVWAHPALAPVPV